MITPLRRVAYCAGAALYFSVIGDGAICAATGEADWPLHGRTHDEQRFSPLDEIQRSNVERLGLAWYFDVPTSRGMEATPIVIDGTMYVSGAWSIVYALDAATGALRWKFDPGVDRSWLQYACCDAVNRGVAVAGHLVYVATLDGYLVAIDRATGRQRWRVDTIGRRPGYTITGAPRVVGDQIVIGNGGAEYGVRGFVTAYDAKTGRERWRFYTVPGHPRRARSELETKIARTWTGEWWKFGGGGTVWDGITYDPTLDLVYIGVGNGSPWNQTIRSPAGGDNLFLASIVALRSRTGQYVWHYQTTPGETWDYTATQQMILADLKIAGRSRKVLMQAPKNGFFYVLDRETGELISARNYVPVSWASGVDPQSGRPQELPGARYGTNGRALVEPSGGGGHNWHPMAYSPQTGLVYFTSQRAPEVFQADRAFRHAPGFWNTGVDLSASFDAAMKRRLDADHDIYPPYTSALQAWDPVNQREVWRASFPYLSRAGTLATAGGVVFAGAADGAFRAYDAYDGSPLWSFSAGTGIAAGPVSYAIRGEQYIAVAVGTGGAAALAGGDRPKATRLPNRSRILAFTLHGAAALPAVNDTVSSMPPSRPAASRDCSTLGLGRTLYHQRCAMCHGWDAISGGLVPDLRHSPFLLNETWDLIVRNGVKRSVGMPAFGSVLDEQESSAIRSYIVARAEGLSSPRCDTEQQ